MTAIISILRGVQLAPFNRITMDALRELYTSLDLVDPQTYIQSGNVIFGIRRKENLDKLATRIHGAIRSKLGVDSPVVLRTVADFKGLIERNPFATRTDVAPNRLAVLFLADEPDEERRGNLGKRATGPEEVHLLGRDLFIHYSHGFADSKLTATVIDKVLQTTCTARNWNTVTKLLELAQKWEATH
jgi:uncharacterized protein (DUF1697 family)